MSAIMLDTSSYVDTGFLQLNQVSQELMSLYHQFDNVIDQDRMDIILENDIEEDQTNPFLPSMEEARDGYASTSTAGAYDTVAHGLANKTKNAVIKGVKATATGAVKSVKPVTGGLIKLARAFMEKISELMNSVSTMVSKMLATGYPLMGKLTKQAEELKVLASKHGQREQDVFELKKASKFLMVGESIGDPSTIIKQLDLVNEIQKTVLSREKLERFKDLSTATLEPYRNSIQTSKADTLVFMMAVLGTLLNPGVVVGAVLKKIFSAANPGLGQKLDIAAKGIGGAYYGAGALAIATGTTSATYLKQMQAGRLDISALPKFQPIYPFCNEEMESKEGSFFVSRKSEVMLGNRQWVVKDYRDSLTADMKGSVQKAGARFEPIKVSGSTNTVKTLSPNEVKAICELVTEILANAQAYCKQWPVYAKTYNGLYRKVSDIVMTYEPPADDDKKTLTSRYIRHSYRNAMNIMLGGIWTNCFGSDNQFVRYLVGLCRTLLIYCRESLDLKTGQEEGSDKEQAVNES